MSKKVYNYKSYVVLDTGRELIVKDSKGKYENHAHFYRTFDKEGKLDLEAAKTCIGLCDRKRMDIRSDYMMNAVMRLTKDKKYKESLKRKMDKEKQRYVDTRQKNLNRRGGRK